MQLSADIKCAYCYSYAKQLLPRYKNDVTASWEWRFLAAVMAGRIAQMVIYRKDN